MGCHRPCIPDRVILEKFVQILVFGCAYRRIAEEGCLATAILDRRDEWIELRVMEALRQNGECQRRQGMAAYSFGGRLDPDWNPAYSGSYSLVWDLHTEGLRLHTGGEFKKVSSVTQNSYARLSP